MTKYIRLFKKGMYRFCMMFLLIFIDIIRMQCKGNRNTDTNRD